MVESSRASIDDESLLQLSAHPRAAIPHGQRPTLARWVRLCCLLWHSSLNQSQESGVASPPQTLCSVLLYSSGRLAKTASRARRE